MDRRDFLRLATTASALGLVGPAGAALAKAGDPWARAFRAALKQKPYLLGWLGTDEARLETSALKIKGKWPAGLDGTFYRNGPARHEVGGMRYRHWFDGDGMVQAFRMHDGRISHLGRLVETSKYVAERKAGRALRSTFGTAVPGAPPPTNPDSVNTANINVLSHGGRFLALWEGGSAHEIDPATLATRGLHTWSKQTRGLPFGAHPRVDPDGTLWNIGYATWAGVLMLYRIGADGKLIRAVPVKLGQVPMVHDFVVTERHLVVVLAPFSISPDRSKPFLERNVWRGDKPARVLIVDKADMARRRILEMPAHWVFHYGNAWEDKAGMIRMDAARYPDPSVIFGALRDVMKGEATGSLPARPYLMTIDPAKGRVREQPLAAPGITGEFPHVDRRLAGRRYRKVTLLSRDPKSGAAHPMHDTVVRLDVETGRMTGFTYGPSVIPEEHLFVPRAGSTGEDDGWLIGTSLDFAAGVTRVAAFDAARLGDGPLAVASLPYALPLGFHGTFVPA